MKPPLPVTLMHDSKCVCPYCISDREYKPVRRVRDCRVCLSSVDFDSQPKTCPHCGADNPLAD